MTVRFRAKIDRRPPIVLEQIGGGDHVVLPAGWRYRVFDMDRVPSQRLIMEGERGSHREALAAACSFIGWRKGVPGG